MLGKEIYFEELCDRYIGWFDGFIEKAKEARGGGI